ncbi:regulatory protein GemA [Methylosinus sp. Sm6]|uniref:regulatory protein GemA n=1 Tax=Methylosinus sp. Sm6 TaxID=2866948 RepID=UPI0021022A50|nr:regulatory protein GemA [Methylosinus sp. Sm6]
MTTSAQTRAIHAALKKMPQFTEQDYRDLLAREFGGRSSSRLLDTREAARLIDMLNGLSGGAAMRRPAETASGPYAPILRALWIGAWNLGLARSRDDQALLAFVARQTGLSHTRFLNDPGDAAKAIEGVKKWMARDGGVEWPKGRGEDSAARKMALLKAIARRCFETSAFLPFVPGADFERAWPSDFELFGYRQGLPAGFDSYTGEDIDRLAARLGARLRAAQDKQKRKAA